MNLLDKFHFKDKNGNKTTMEICDSFSRSKIAEVVGMIPTKVSQLVNDSGYALKSYVDQVTGSLAASIPTKTSDLQNNSGFITSANVPTKTSELQNDSGFTTFSGNYNDLTNKPTIPSKTSQLQNDSNLVVMTALATIQNMSVNKISTGYSTSLGAYIIQFYFPDNTWFRLELSTSTIKLVNSGSGTIWSK